MIRSTVTRVGCWLLWQKIWDKWIPLAETGWLRLECSSFHSSEIHLRSERRRTFWDRFSTLGGMEPGLKTEKEWVPKVYLPSGSSPGPVGAAPQVDAQCQWKHPNWFVDFYDPPPFFLQTVLTTTKHDDDFPSIVAEFPLDPRLFVPYAPVDKPRNAKSIMVF